MKIFKRTKKEGSGEKKKGLKVWQTVLSVIAGVFLVSGATILGVYLAGGFNEKVVNPDIITFEGGYDLNLYNTDYSQLEVVGDFELTILTPTEDVTRNKVNLSFPRNSTLPITTADGYISNTIIQVPQVVELGKPFTVHLLTELLKDETSPDGYYHDENGNYVDWIKGGEPTVLIASSEYDQISETSITIAVDVPVYKTEIEVYNSNGVKTNQVVTYESFTLKTKFIPARSEYMYSDDANANVLQANRRVKRSYYEARQVESSTNYIFPVYDGKHEMHFTAGVEAVNGNAILSHTFKDARTQIEFENSLEDMSDSEYYNAAIVYLARNTEKSVSSSVSVNIGEASIEGFSVSKSNIKMNVGQTLRLYMNRNIYDTLSEFLGVRITSTSSALLERMLANIAIAFTTENGTDPTQGNNAFLQVRGGEAVEIDNVTYYKPNAVGANFNYAYWDLSASEEANVIMEVVLIENKSEGSVLFTSGENALKYNVNLEITNQIELPLTWTDQTDINIMLEYGNDGKPVQQTVDLAPYVANSVPENNKYKDIVFFAWFGAGDKESLKATVDSVLGTTGYNYERSGQYATDTENLLLFAIEGDSITLYNTGTFRLYFATKKTEGGNDIYTSEGLYDLAVMCSGYVNVTCEKALYNDSVKGATIDVGNFESEAAEVAIDQGSDKDFGISFRVNSESVPVFETEYNMGYMSLAITDIQNTDITSNFIIDNETFTIDPETDEGILEFRLKVNEASAINEKNGIYLSRMTLVYNDTVKEPINWTFSVPQELIVCIYDPEAEKTEIIPLDGYTYNSIITGGETINVVQDMQESGVFATTLSFTLNGELKTFNSVEDLLVAILGNEKSYVVVTDQKGNTSTLAREWKFAIKDGDSSIINISSDGKSFTFRDAENSNIELYIESNDGQSSTLTNNNYIKLNITSKGVPFLKKANTLSTYETVLSDLDNNVTTAEVTKYGARGTDGQYIVLSDIVKYYLSDSTPYTKYDFRLSSQYITGSTLSDDMVVDLFADGGMITLYTTEDMPVDFRGDYSATNIRNTLISTIITKFTINKNFAINHTLQFSITDTAGAVNTSFNLNLQPNIEVSSQNYPQSGVLYANSEVAIVNTVTNRNAGTTDGTFADSLYADNYVYYVVYQEGRYSLTSEEPDSYVATYQLGKIKFKDFWEEESRVFNVYFQPEGDNQFALNKSIEFVVTRDLKITDKNGSFVIVKTGDTTIDRFVSITRNDDSVLDANISLTYTFDEYLEYRDGVVKKEDGVKLFFDYNKQELYTNLIISLDNNGDLIELASIRVAIKLVDSDDLYQTLAETIELQNRKDDAGQPITGIHGTTQIVGDTEYLVINVAGNDNTWKFGQISTFVITPTSLDYFNNSLTFYSINGSSKQPPIIFNRQQYVLAGLNDSSMYLALNFYSSSASNIVEATVHVPIILSSIGYTSVVYDAERGVEDNRTLETALARPETLFDYDEETGVYTARVYNEIYAGQLTKILHEYNFGEIVSTGGLYTLPGYTQNIQFYSLDSKVAYTDEKLINEKLVSKYPSNNESYGYLTLNHLSTALNDTFLALEYTITNDRGFTQYFYYLLKVLPDVVVEDELYAYDGSAEYITAPVNSNTSIDLEGLFDDTTIYPGYRRFNVSKNLVLQTVGENVLTEVKFNVTSEIMRVKLTYTVNGSTSGKILELNYGETVFDLASISELTNAKEGQVVNILIISGEGKVYYNKVAETDIMVFSSLAYTNEVVSVTVNSDPLYDGTWGGDIRFEISGSVLYITPIKDGKMIAEISHTYQGGEGSYAVVGGEQKYTLVINESIINYTVRFTDDNSGTNQVTTNYVWNIENKDGADEATREKTLTINLLQGSQAGPTIVRNLMNARITKGSVGEDGDIKSYSYDNGSAIFTLELNEYIDSDREIYFSFYTDTGYLARLTVNLKANASFALRPSFANATLQGGVDYNFNDIFEIKLGDEVNNTYTVTGEIVASTNNDSSFIKWNEGKLLLADVRTNKTVTVNFTVSFDDEKQFKFSQTFTLTPNFAAKSTFTPEKQNTISGQDHKITLEELYTGFLKEGSTVTISATSSSLAFVNNNPNNLLSIDADGKAIVNTSYVSEIVPVDLNLVITITSEGFAVTEVYSMIYSFTAYPSVQLGTNYPIPAEEELEVEYLENMTEFENIVTFAMNKPIFGTDNRFVVNGAQKDEETDIVTYDLPEILTTDNSDLSVIVSGLTNAVISVLTEVEGEDGSDEVYVPAVANTEIPLNRKIRFERGTPGIDSIAIITLTYKQFSEIYNIQIQNNSLSIRTNNDSRYVSAGNYNNDTVDYETLYVDKISTENLFGQGRLAGVQMQGEIQSLIDEYYFVFKDKTADNYFASYPILITSDLKGNIKFDLGMPMGNRVFIGAYSTSVYDNLFGLDSNRQLSKVEDPNAANKTFIPLTSADVEFVDFLENQNKASRLFVDGDKGVKLLNRIQLVYGSSIEVDYSKYANSLYKTDENEGFNLPTGGIDIISAADTIKEFNRDDGSVEPKVSFNSYKYYYMPSIDITVENAVKSSSIGGQINYNGNYILQESDSQGLVVNNEYTSFTGNGVVSLFGIKHPTNGRLVSKAEFNKDTVINLTVIDPTTAMATESSIIAGYNNIYKNEKGKEIGFKKQTAKGEDYLRFAGVKNNSDVVYDYDLFPSGAKNDGDFVLVKVTYSSLGFTKDFYVVVKIVTDYDVQFVGNADNAMIEYTENGDQIVSNKQEAMEVTQAESDGTYININLTDSSTGVSIKHKNGLTAGNEVASSNFTITLPINQSVDGDMYNVPQGGTSVHSKLNLGTNWNTDNSACYKYLRTDSIVLQGVVPVIFADQKYYIDGEDDFGFKFRLYFTLKPTGGNIAPSPVESVIQIKEEGTFDIGVQFDLLTIVEESNPSTNLYITRSVEHPTKEPDSLTVIELQGIKAWLFKENYTLGSKQYLLNNHAGGYNLVEGKTFSSSTDKDYLDINTLTLDNITISEITFYRQDNNAKIGPTLSGGAKTLATNGGAGYVYNGVNPRSSSANFTMPRFEDTDIFGNGNVANITMFIKLNYSSNGVTEQYNCPVNIELIREITFETGLTAVYDGEEIEVANQVKSSIGNVTYLNDNLDVMIDANLSTNFTMELYDGNNRLLSTAYVSRSNAGTSYAKTYYVSLSQEFNVTMHAGYRVEVKPSDNNAKFYYGTGPVSLGDKGEDVEFYITTILNDKLFLDDASMVAKGTYANATRYYVAQVLIGTTSYYYRIEKRYAVTARYFDMVVNNEFASVLQKNETAVGNWLTPSATFYDAKTDERGIVVRGSTSSTITTSDFTFSIDPSEGAAGRASIDARGTITIDNDFRAGEYIKVLIYTYVTGNGRGSLDTSGNSGKVELGFVKLELAQ